FPAESKHWNACSTRMNVLGCALHCAPGVRQNSSPQSKSPIAKQLLNCGGQLTSPTHAASFVIGVEVKASGIVAVVSSGSCASSRDSGGVAVHAPSPHAIMRDTASPLMFMEYPPDGDTRRMTSGLTLGLWRGPWQPIRGPRWPIALRSQWLASKMGR